MTICLFLLAITLCCIIYFSKVSPRMWRHLCPIEHDWMEIADGDCCNWCGKTNTDKGKS